MTCDIDYTRGCNTLDDSLTNCSTRMCSKLKVYDWLQDVPEGTQINDIVEIRFKNTRKDFYRNVNGLNLKIGDVVAVEASPGHDIGTVSLTGQLVYTQLNKYRVLPNVEFKKIYRKAKPADVEKWKNSIAREPYTMLRSRQIAEDLKLDMKIGDVEFQGDGTKAIFYYIADERVDFRELIKVFAEQFKIRIEMKQIGARQEAGRIGGIGSCGRELCCSTWITNFVSVTTVSAKVQELSLNPQKLAGQCGKLKCCLNYEYDSYMDAQSDFPDTTIVLETKNGKAYHQKTDIYKRTMWYSFDEHAAVNLTPVDVERVKEVIRLNKKGVAVESLAENNNQQLNDILGFEDLDKNLKNLKKNDDNKRRKRESPEEEEEINHQEEIELKKTTRNRNPDIPMKCHPLKNPGLSIIALLLIFLLSSCSKSYFFNSEVEIPNGAWKSEKVAIFEPVISDTNQNYNIILSISNTDEYRYSNIWFFIKTISPDGVSQKDTLQYLMAEDNGKWLGKKSGDNYEQMFYFKDLIRFPKAGKYTFEIQQGMRDIELKGITKVGVLFEEIKQI